MSILSNLDNDLTYWVGGSGVNWTGPKRVFGSVSVQIGYSWPERATLAMFYGAWEDAVPHLIEINKFLGDNKLLSAVPNDGQSILGTYGFETRRFQERKETEYSERRAKSEAQLLLGYRKEGMECPRREVLEDCARTGKGDGFFLKDRDMELFLKELYS